MSNEFCEHCGAHMKAHKKQFTKYGCPTNEGDVLGILVSIALFMFLGMFLVLITS